MSSKRKMGTLGHQRVYSREANGYQWEDRRDNGQLLVVLSGFELV